jgi:uncharacterized protein (TIGR00299 family) protein
LKKAIYLDLSFGIAGDMFIAALTAASGAEGKEIFENYSRRIDEKFGVKASLKEVIRSGIRGFQLELQEPPENLSSYEKFRQAILDLKLSERVVNLAIEIIENLFQAEAIVHGTNFSETHFHELGKLDTLFDAVLAAALVIETGVEAVFASPVAVGSGRIRIEHGIVSLPAPATAELLRGMPLTGADLKGEVTTPTGAAILRALKPQFIFPDGFLYESIGYGFGQREAEHPNYLRLFYGWIEENLLEPVYEVATNLDDVTPQILSFLIERLLQANALDAWIEPIVMKKGRPGHKLCFLAYEKDLEKLIDVVFKETPTLGVRYHRVSRKRIERKIEVVETEYGPVRVKVARKAGELKLTAEFDDCLKIASKFGLPADLVKRKIEHECALKLADKAKDFD